MPALLGQRLLPRTTFDYWELFTGYKTQRDEDTPASSPQVSLSVASWKIKTLMHNPFVKKLTLLACGTFLLIACIGSIAVAQAPENYIAVGMLGLMAAACFVAAAVVPSD